MTFLNRGRRNAPTSLLRELDDFRTLSFENGTLTPYPNGWDAVNGTGLAVNGSAAKVGAYGFSVGISDVAARYGQLTSLQQMKKATFRFFVDLNSLAMGDPKDLNICYSNTEGQGRPFVVQIRYTGGGYYFRAFSYEDGTINTTPILSPEMIDDWHEIQIEWFSATSPGDDDGYFKFYVDGILMGQSLDLDNDQVTLDWITLGSPTGSDASISGTLFFDYVRLAGNIAELCLGYKALWSFGWMTDVHIDRNGDTEKDKLNAAVAYYNALRPQPLFIVDTGDLVEDGTNVQYPKYLAETANLQMPLHCLPGNHDEQWSRQYYDAHIGTLQWVIDQGDLRLIGFFSRALFGPDYLDAEVTAADLAFIEASLQNLGGRTPICLSHNPVYDMRYHHEITTGKAALIALFTTYGVKGHLGGHVHVPLDFSFQDGFMQLVGFAMSFNNAPAETQGGLHVCDVYADKIIVTCMRYEGPGDYTLWKQAKIDL